MNAEEKSMGPMTERFDLLSFTDGLIGDLRDLRKGKISVRDARARAEIARQVLRAVHYVVTAQKYIEQNALPVPTGRPTEPKSEGK
jgi:hypothetical protein